MSTDALSYLYADDDVLVLDKPPGLLCVPGRGPDKQDCLSSRAQARWPDALVVHRLDMATSGLVVMARSKAVQAQLSQAFALRQVHKRYIAVAYGQPSALQALPMGQWQEVSAPLRCDWERRPLQIVDPIAGKPSLTRYCRAPEPPHPPAGCTRLLLEPVTGRSHQLRVHLAHVGLPLLGDALYAPPAAQAQRLFLHACALGFDHPRHQHPVFFESPANF